MILVRIDELAESYFHKLEFTKGKGSRLWDSYVIATIRSPRTVYLFVLTKQNTRKKKSQTEILTGSTRTTLTGINIYVSV